MMEVAAGVVRDGRGRVLIARRMVDARGEWAALEGLWEFPGGKREADESYEACLVRELREELELRVTPVRVLLETDHPTGEKTIHLAFVEATADANGPLALNAHTEAVWARPEQLKDYAFCPADAAFVGMFNWAAWNARHEGCGNDGPV